VRQREKEGMGEKSERDLTFPWEERERKKEVK